MEILGLKYTVSNVKVPTGGLTPRTEGTGGGICDVRHRTGPAAQVSSRKRTDRREGQAQSPRGREPGRRAPRSRPGPPERRRVQVAQERGLRGNVRICPRLSKDLCVCVQSRGNSKQVESEEIHSNMCHSRIFKTKDKPLKTKDRVGSGENTLHLQGKSNSKDR